MVGCQHIRQILSRCYHVERRRAQPGREEVGCRVPNQRMTQTMSSRDVSARDPELELELELELGGSGSKSSSATSS